MTKENLQSVIPNNDTENNQHSYKIILLCVVIIGLSLRLFFMHGRHFVDDELGTLLWMKKDYHFLLTHFASHWLTMNFYIAFLKLINQFGNGKAWVLVAPSLIGGMALIPIIYQLGLKVGAHKETALIASFLVAVNPFLIRYSVIIRSYSMLLAFAACALLLFFIWQKNKTWTNGVLFGVSLFLAFMMHANTLYHAVFIGILFFCTVYQKDKKNITIILPTIIAAIATIYFYFPLLDQIIVYKQKFSQPSPAPIDYLPELTWRFWGGGFYEVPSLILLGFGLWFSLKKNDSRLSLLLLGIITPLFLSSMAGVSVAKYAMGRFLITTLPIIILFIAEAVQTISLHLKYSRFFMVFLTFSIFLTWLPRTSQVFNRQKVRPWHKIIVFLNKNLKGNDYILPLARAADFNISFISLPQHVDKGRIIKINHFLNQTFDCKKRIRILAISDIPMSDSKTIYQAGQLRVLSYSGDCKEKIAQSILRDIKNALKDRISSEYTSYYRAMVQLLSALPLNNEIPKYISLYYESKLIGLSGGGNPLIRRKNYYLRHHKMIGFDVMKNTFPMKF